MWLTGPFKGFGPVHWVVHIGGVQSVQELVKWKWKKNLKKKKRIGAFGLTNGISSSLLMVLKDFVGPVK